MDPAKCKPGLAVTVRAADDFYKYIDGWKGVISDMPAQAGCLWVECPSPVTDTQQIGPVLKFLIPPDQLEANE